MDIQQNWIVWNSETKSIQAYGFKGAMQVLARQYREMYQTDAYQAKEFIEQEG